jgi:hypothetical protein
MNPMPTMLNDAAYATLESGLSAPRRAALGALYARNANLGMHVLDRAALAAHPQRAALEAEADAVGINAVMFHNRDTTYQFYEMARLAEDIDRALAADLDVLHLAPAPLKTADVYAALNGGEMPPTTGRLHAEDMRTRHAGLWGAEGAYIRGADDVLAALAQFFRAETRS